MKFFGILLSVFLCMPSSGTAEFKMPFCAAISGLVRPQPKGFGYSITTFAMKHPYVTIGAFYALVGAVAVAVVHRDDIKRWWRPPTPPPVAPAPIVLSAGSEQSAPAPTSDEEVLALQEQQAHKILAWAGRLPDIEQAIDNEDVNALQKLLDLGKCLTATRQYDLLDRAVAKKNDAIIQAILSFCDNGDLIDVLKCAVEKNNTENVKLIAARLPRGDHRSPLTSYLLGKLINKAFENGNADIFDILCRCSNDKITLNCRNNHPLEIAAKKCDTEMINALLKHGFRDDSPWEEDGLKRLNKAISPAVAYLIEYGYKEYIKCDTELRVEFLDTVLPTLCRLVCGGGGKAKLSACINVVLQEEGNRQILHDYQLAVAKKLIELDREISDDLNVLSVYLNEKSGYHDMSPLLAAIYNDNFGLLIHLFVSGAKIDPKEQLLSRAVKNNNIEMVQYLITKGVTTPWDTEVLCAAVDNNNAEMLELLIQKKVAADVNKPLNESSVNRDTVLDYTVSKGNYELAKLLIEKYDAVATPLTMKRALYHGSNMQLIQLLQEKKLTIPVIRLNNVQRAHHSVMRFCVENGAFPEGAYIFDKYIECFFNPIKPYDRCEYNSAENQCSLISLKLLMAHGQPLVGGLDGQEHVMKATFSSNFKATLEKVKDVPVLCNFLTTIFDFDTKCRSGEMRTIKDVSDFAQQNQTQFDEDHLDQSISNQLDAKDKLLLKGHESFCTMLALRSQKNRPQVCAEYLSALKNKNHEYLDAYAYKSSTHLKQELNKVEEKSTLLTKATKKQFVDVSFKFND